MTLNQQLSIRKGFYNLPTPASLFLISQGQDCEDIIKMVRKLDYDLTDGSGISVSNIGHYAPDIILVASEEDKNQNIYKEIRKHVSTPVLFLSEFLTTDVFMIENRDKHVSQLLLPFSVNELHAAIELSLYKYRKMLKLGSKKAEEIKKVSQIKKANDECIALNLNGRSRKIKYADVICLESIGSSTIVKTIDKNFVIGASIQTLMDRLPEAEYKFVNDNFVVNVGRIQVVEEKGVVINNQLIPLSPNFKDDIANVAKDRRVVYS